MNLVRQSALLLSSTATPKDHSVIYAQVTQLYRAMAPYATSTGPAYCLKTHVSKNLFGTETCENTTVYIPGVWNQHTITAVFL
jgi:hypothetical protein